MAFFDIKVNNSEYFIFMFYRSAVMPMGWKTVTVNFMLFIAERLIYA